MKMSTRGRYGLRFMIELAMHGRNGPLALRDVAERQGISEKYLWQIINPLKAAGLIRSVAGAHGGFELNKPGEEITTWDILRHLEGDFRLISCAENEECERYNVCAAQVFWRGLEATIQEYLSSRTLKQLVDEQLQNDKKRPINYSI